MSATVRKEPSGTAKKTPQFVGWTAGVKGLSVPLASGALLIGSGRQAGFKISDPLASRRHAELVRQPGGSCYLKDLGSRNGTHVNGLKLQPERPVELRHGDTVFFAQQGFRFDNGSGLATTRTLAWRGAVLVAVLLALLAGVRFCLV